MRTFIERLLGRRLRCLGSAKTTWPTDRGYDYRPFNTSRWSRISSSTLILIFVALLGMTGLSWRNALLRSPIYGYDEYAYFAIGKAVDHQTILFENDPYLQRLSNVLYFRVVNVAELFTPKAWKTLKLINVLLYGLAGLGLALIARKLLTAGAAVCFLVLYFAIPWSGYTASVQPEVFAYFAILVTAGFAIAAARLRSIIVCAVTGFLLAAAYYIKPSAIAVAVGTAIFFASQLSDDWRSRRERVEKAVVVLAAFMAALYAGLLIWPWIFGAHWQWSPYVSSFYQAQLAQPSGGWVPTALQFSSYFGGHLVVLSIIFPAGIVGLAKTIQESRGIGSPVTLAGLLARWLLLVGAASIVAVSYYSVKSGIADPLGARLHGRYLGFLFPFLLLFTLRFCYPNSPPETEAVDRRSFWLRLAGILLLTGVTAWLSLIRPYFHLYPWDYPDSLTMFPNPNDYGYSNPFWSRLCTISAAIAAGVALISRRPFAKHLVITYLVLCLMLASRTNTMFQLSVSRTLSQLTIEAGSLSASAKLAGKDGLVVGENKGGRMPYVLFGLASEPVVLNRSPGSEISLKDLPPKCAYVLFTTHFVPTFQFKSLVQTPNLELFILD